MSEPLKKWQRVTLTKAARATELGAALVKILGEILGDGRIEDCELNRLRLWLTESADAQGELPALGALRDAVESALSDGNVTDEERREIVALMLRVLPAEDREAPHAEVARLEQIETEKLRAHREDQAKAEVAEKEARAQERANRRRIREEKERQFHEEAEERRRQREAEWQSHRSASRSQPATEPQLNYLRALGANYAPWITKGEASDLIGSMLGGCRSVSNRQMMVLRFWDCVSVADGGRSAVCDLMDEWYAMDSDHVAAWEMWKEAHGDCGRQSDPSIIELGEGERWLRIVKERTAAPNFGGDAQPVKTPYDVLSEYTKREQGRLLRVLLDRTHPVAMAGRGSVVA